jgi:hypothetical protein
MAFDVSLFLLEVLREERTQEHYIVSVLSSVQRNRSQGDEVMTSEYGSDELVPTLRPRRYLSKGQEVFQGRDLIQARVCCLIHYAEIELERWMMSVWLKVWM